MSRVQLALNVSDLEAGIEFYSKLFATEPRKVRPGYANFAIADPPLKLILVEHPGSDGRLNHLGVEVETTEEVVAATERRLSDEGLGRRHRGRRSSVATPSRTRCGSTIPTGAVGDLHRARGRRAPAGRACAPPRPPTGARPARRRRRAAVDRATRSRRREAGAEVELGQTPYPYARRAGRATPPRPRRRQQAAARGRSPGGGGGSTADQPVGGCAGDVGLLVGVVGLPARPHECGRWPPPRGGPCRRRRPAGSRSDAEAPGPGRQAARRRGRAGGAGPRPGQRPQLVRLDPAVGGDVERAVELLAAGQVDGGRQVVEVDELGRRRALGRLARRLRPTATGRASSSAPRTPRPSGGAGQRRARVVVLVHSWASRSTSALWVAKESDGWGRTGASSVRGTGWWATPRRPWRSTGRRRPAIPTAAGGVEQPAGALDVHPGHARAVELRVRSHRRGAR